jgi:hypothetical protein
VPQRLAGPSLGRPQFSQRTPARAALQQPENRSAGTTVWINVRIFLGAGIALVALVAIVAGIVWLGDDGGEGQVAQVRLEGDASEAQGVAHFEQDGSQMTGFVVVWGLEPNSEHAVHFHGPDGRCGTKADPVAVHPDLKADANGVAYTRIDLTAEQDLLEGGFYYNVHEGPSRLADNPEIVCGDIGTSSAAAGASP